MRTRDAFAALEHVRYEASCRVAMTSMIFHMWLVRGDRYESTGNGQRSRVDPHVVPRGHRGFMQMSAQKALVVTDEF